MSALDINKAYVSPIDKFFFEFDATHEKTASQLEEIRKHQRIAALRDTPRTVGEEEVMWGSF
jgi:hypothetical protein